MTIRRRQALAAAGLLAAALPPARALGQPAAWQPTRPVQLFVGFAPGGGADLIARSIAEAAQPLYPQPLVVVNRPGAGGTIAAQHVAGLPPDGHALLMGGGSDSTSMPAFRDLPYDPKRDLRAVIRLMRQRMFILSHARGPLRSMQDALAAARARPGAVSHASSGVGSLYHALFLLLEQRTGLEFLHVPFTGGAPGLQAVAARQVDLGVGAPEEFRGLLDAGELRPLALSSDDRAPAFPEVPTLRELGIDLEMENMKGWVAPAATPPEILAAHHDRFRRAMAMPAWRNFLERAGDTDGYLDGAAFQAAMDRLLDQVRGAAPRRA